MIKEFQFRGKAFKVWCVETVPNHPTWYSFVDEQEVRDAYWDVREGDVVMDVGAAYGSYALSALAVGAAFVWAWSPQGFPGEDPEETVLRRSLEANGWSDRCRTYGEGLYDKPGYLHTVSQAFSQDPWPDPDPDVIRVDTIDSWASRDLPSGGKVDWMKFDVEGAEVEVIDGGSGLIREFLPMVLVETHAFKRASIEQEVRDLLQSIGPYRHVATRPHHSVTHSLYVCGE